MRKYYLLLIASFCTIFFAKSQETAFALEAGLQTRNDHFATLGMHYSFFGNSWAELQSITAAYGYGLGGEYQMAEIGYTYAIIFIMPSVNLTQTWDRSGNGNFGIEPRIGVGAHGLYSLQLGYNFRVNSAIPDYTNKFNLILKLGSGWWTWPSDEADRRFMKKIRAK
jgi:hypothetical protein